MQYKYVDGYSWDKIGNIMHFDRRTGERIVSRYLNQNKNTKKNTIIIKNAHNARL